MPRLARIVATASGWVMYGSPDLRNCPECHCAAVSWARCSSRVSAFGWVARWVAISGSSTSLTCGVCQGALNRARRARTRRPVGSAEAGRRLGADVPAEISAASARSGPGRATRPRPSVPTSSTRSASSVGAGHRRRPAFGVVAGHCVGRPASSAGSVVVGRPSSSAGGVRRRRSVASVTAPSTGRAWAPVVVTVPSTGGAMSLGTGRSSPHPPAHRLQQEEADTT